MAEPFAEQASPMHARASPNSDGSLATYPSLGPRVWAVLVWQLSLARAAAPRGRSNLIFWKTRVTCRHNALCLYMICFDVKINLNLNLCLLNLCLLIKLDKTAKQQKMNLD